MVECVRLVHFIDGLSITLNVAVVPNVAFNIHSVINVYFFSHGTQPNLDRQVARKRKFTKDYSNLDLLSTKAQHLEELL